MTDLVDDVPSAPRDADRVHNYRCSNCGKGGHNARTCGLTDDERRSRRRGAAK